MNKEFKWDDESVMEFYDFHRKRESQWTSESIQHFKKSKQPKPEWEIKEGLCEPQIVIGFDNYLIYKNGNVWNKKSNKYVKHSFNGNYTNITFRKNGQYYPRMLHRLIAEHFIPNPNNKPCVNHINGQKTDNRIENLEWATFSENNKHAFDNQLRIWEESSRIKIAKTRGCAPIIAKYNGEIAGIFYTKKECERVLGVNNGNIGKCLKGKLKQCNGYEFEYTTEEVAEEYILMNKPLFCISEIVSDVVGLSAYKDNYIELLIGMAKEKLNKP